MEHSSPDSQPEDTGFLPPRRALAGSATRLKGRCRLRCVSPGVISRPAPARVTEDRGRGRMRKQNPHPGGPAAATARATRRGRPSWRPHCTLFKNPFRTWEAFTERNRGIRMGFSRITATRARVRSRVPSSRSPWGSPCPAAGAGRSAGLSKPFLSRSVQGVFGAPAPPPDVQQGLSPTEGTPPHSAQDLAGASSPHTAPGGRLCT